MVCVTAVFVAGPASSSSAASIWKRAQASSRLDLFSSEEKVWKKHDLVKVMIVERTSAAHDDETEIQKDNSFTAELTDWFRWDFGKSKPVAANTFPKIGYTSDKDFESEASVEKDSSFQGQIAAEVLEVLPNGNLVISARKEIRIGKDLQRIMFTGVVMPRDIDDNSQVISTDVADASIEFSGTGPVSDAQKQGLLARLLDKYWIF